MRPTTLERLRVAAPKNLRLWMMAARPEIARVVDRTLTPATVLLGSPSPSGQVFEGIRGVAKEHKGDVLVSAGSLFQKEGFVKLKPRNIAALQGASLDSSGYVAMVKFGGYRWTPEEYVDQVVSNFGARDPDFAFDPETQEGDVFPWSWWSAMDYACEEEIAPNREEIEKRIRLTTETLGRMYNTLDAWRQYWEYEGMEGWNFIQDPMPIVQGRTSEDYIESAKQIGEMLRQHGREWPDLIGVGSVCRRPIHDTAKGAGIVSIVDTLDKVLPPHVRLHLFGVKGRTLTTLKSRPSFRRIGSVDSMAFEYAARMDALKRGVPKTVDLRVEHARRWREKQSGYLDQPED